MGFFSGGGVAKSASQGFSSNAKDPAVAKTGTQYPAKVTYNAKGNTSGTSPKPPKKPSALEKKVYDVTGSIARDLNMGLSTFGQSKEKQTATLQAAGYSDDVIKDYQARTEATKARMASMNTRTEYGNDDSGRRPAPDIPYKQTTAPGFTGQPPSTPTPPPTPTAPTPIAEAPGTGVTSAASGEAEAAEIEATAGGPAEKEVAKTARKGRRATIQTGPQGLLTKARTRRRRSLMGGDEPRGLIS